MKTVFTKQERKYKHLKYSHKRLHSLPLWQRLGTYSGTGMVSEEERKIHYNTEKKKAKLMRKSSFWQSKVSKEGKCYYCSTPLTFKDATLDHILPLSKGGTTHRGNVAVACKSCNSEKRDKTPFEWLHTDSPKTQETSENSKHA